MAVGAGEALRRASSGTRWHGSHMTHGCNPKHSRSDSCSVHSALPNKQGFMNHLRAKLRASRGIHGSHQTPGRVLPSPSHSTVWSVGRKPPETCAGKMAQSSFCVLNKQNQADSASAQAAPEGIAQGISKGMLLQRTSAPSTENFLAYSHYDLLPPPPLPVSLRGSRDCVAPARRSVMGAATPSMPREAEVRKLKSKTPGQGPLHPQKPTWHTAGGMGYRVIPRQTTSLRDPETPPAYGEKQHQHYYGAGTSPPGTGWPPSAARQGRVSEPAPALPHAGEACPLSESSDSDPRPVPSWLDRHAVFCLKRKRVTQGETSKGPSPSYPHTNRFI